MAKQGALIIFLLYFIFGLYFVNSTFNFISLPQSILNFDKWMRLIGGILIFIGAINYFRASRVSRMKYLAR